MKWGNDLFDIRAISLDSKSYVLLAFYFQLVHLVVSSKATIKVYLTQCSLLAHLSC